MSGYSHPKVEGGIIRSYDGTYDYDDVRETIKRVRITAPADGTEQDTAYDLPDDAIVLDVWLNVITAEATGTTKTVDVGTAVGESGGDPNGFLAAVSVAATGFVRGTLLNTGQTLGALLSVDESGAGVLVPEPYLTSANTAKSLVYTAGSADFAELVADIYIRMLTIEDR